MCACLSFGRSHASSGAAEAVQPASGGAVSPSVQATRFHPSRSRPGLVLEATAVPIGRRRRRGTILGIGGSDREASEIIFCDFGA